MIVLAVGAVLATLIHFFPLSGIVYYLCPWIYIPCFLYISRNLKSKVQAGCWLLFWVVSFMIRFWGIVRPFSIGISIILSVAGALIYAIPFAVDRLTYDKGSRLVSWFVFPCVSAVLDYTMELTRLGSLFCTAQTQFDNKPMLQIGSVIGSKGITFLIALYASLIVYNVKSARRILLCIFALLLIHLCGYARIQIQTPVIEEADTFRMGWSAEPLADAIIDDSFFSESVEGVLEPNVEYLTKAIEKAERQAVQLLCFPEECFYVYEEYREAFIQEAQKLAKDHRMYLLLSVESDDPEDDTVPGTNESVLISDQGEILQEYLKSMLIPVVEEPYYRSGNGVLPRAKICVENRELTVSYAICFDGDFASYVRKIPDDIDLFIDVSWDWDEVAQLHYRIIGLRAVENGLTVVKPTIDGYTTVTDYLGNIHSKTHTDESGYEDVYLVKVPIAKSNTIYHRFGHYIDALYIIGLMILIIIFISGRKKEWKQRNH